MSVTFELWQLITLGITIAGLFIGLGKVLLMQFERRIDERLQALASDSAAWRDLEREFHRLRAELPEKYVRREDYIRGQTVIEAKLDAINSELKVVQMKGGRREN